MLAWICASGMIVLTILGWVSVRRAAHARRATDPAFLSIDLPLTIGVAIGILGSSVRPGASPWISAAGPVSIPIGAGALCMGWMLVRHGAGDFRPRVGSAIGLALAWIVLAGALRTGGLGLAEAAAVLLGLGAWSVLASPGAPGGAGGPSVPRRVIAPFWGIVLVGLAGVLLGLPAAVPWAIAGASIVLLAGTTGVRDGAHGLGLFLGLIVVTPVAGLAMASATRVVMSAAGSGDAMARAGGPWFIGFAQALAARPIAALPAGFAPEMCLIGAALGVGICASKVPRRAQRVLGSVLALAGLGIGALAVIS